MKEQTFWIGEASTYLGVSESTLRRWEKDGLLVPKRSPKNYRMYSKTQLDELLPKLTA